MKLKKYHKLLFYGSLILLLSLLSGVGSEFLIFGIIVALLFVSVAYTKWLSSSTKKPLIISTVIGAVIVSVWFTFIGGWAILGIPYFSALAALAVFTFLGTILEIRTNGKKYEYLFVVLAFIIVSRLGYLIYNIL